MSPKGSSRPYTTSSLDYIYTRAKLFGFVMNLGKSGVFLCRIRFAVYTYESDTTRSQIENFRIRKSLWEPPQLFTNNLHEVS
jgi:hypothetical protein